MREREKKKGGRRKEKRRTATATPLRIDPSYSPRRAEARRTERTEETTTNSSNYLVGSPDTVCFSQDMPMTPSLAPMAPLQMPALNRLTSNDWPLFNRLRDDDRSQGVCIIRTESGKSPTPKAMTDRSISFRNLADSLRAIPSLFRGTSETSSFPAQMDDGGYEALDHHNFHDLPRLFSLPTSPCKGGGGISKENSPVVRDGRRHVHRFRHLDARDEEEDETTSSSPTLEGQRRRGENRTFSADFQNKVVKASKSNTFHPRALLLTSPKPRTIATARSSSSSKRKRGLGECEQETSLDRVVTTATMLKKKMRTISIGPEASSEAGCSCKKSRCRKKYCLCFSEGKACRDVCRCESCGNTPQDGLFDGMFSRQGCRCDNSRCRKKYCICFANAFKCSPFCKCRNCENKPATDSGGLMRRRDMHTTRKRPRTMTLTAAV